MDKNGESIYGTTASPLDAAPKWGRVTQKDKKIYLHIFDWPSDGKLNIEGLPAADYQASLLADAKHSALKAERDGKTLAIELPSAAPDPIDSVIVLESK